MKTLALIGESGTGKSFQAKLVAQRYHADLIIDDGLLIRDNRILAGRSAKQEKSFLAAVKMALFDDKARRDEAARRLSAEKPRRILIIGTSEKMVNKIAIRLQIPSPKKFIKIEDVSSQADIEKAVRIRRIEGKHTIPAPGMEVKKIYPEIFFETVNIFKRKLIEGVGPVPKLHERSLVRPEYSKRSKIIISDAALNEMVINCVDEYNPSLQIKKITIKETPQGYRLAMIIDVPYGISLSGNMSAVQHYIIDNIEHFTGILIEEVNVIIDTLRVV
jgi:ABC-type oligopeptide transport system ATPase subunit